MKLKQIILGVLILCFFTSTVNADTIVGYDDFNRVDSTNLGVNWTERGTTTAISENRLEILGININGAIYNQYNGSNYNISFVWLQGVSYGSTGVVFYANDTTLDGTGYKIRLYENTSTSPMLAWMNNTNIDISVSGGTSAIMDNETVVVININNTAKAIKFWFDDIYRGQLDFNNIGGIMKYSEGYVGLVGYSLTSYTDNFTITIVDKTTSPIFISTSSNITSYEYENDTFTANLSQSCNVSGLVNGVELWTNTSVVTFSYSNSTAMNGTHNITAIISNENGSAQYSWEQLKLLNSFNMMVTDKTATRENFTISNITAGLYMPLAPVWSYLYMNQTVETGTTYTIYYAINDTSTGATNGTVGADGNTTLTLPAGVKWKELDYYILETPTPSTSTETFALATGAFAAVTFITVRITSWVNRRRGRRNT